MISRALAKSSISAMDGGFSRLQAREEAPRQPCQLPPQCRGLSRAACCQNLGFPFHRGILHAQVEAAPPQWVSEPALLVRAQYDEWNRFGFDRAKLWNCVICQALKISRSRASNSWLTLSSSSMSNTQGLSL